MEHLDEAAPSAGAKRARADDAASSSSSSASGAAPETPLARPAPVVRLAQAENFNGALLKYYYQNLFPFKQLTRWLSYGNDPDCRAPGNKPDFFYRREFTFTLEGDIFVRYLCFRDAEQFADAVIKRQPERIEIGPVYSAPPDRHKTVAKEAFKPVERELIFDIDLNDYDDIRTCCEGANICKRCWVFMNVAIRVLDSILREDFGFRHILFVYSGRRGVHCHVGDEVARQLTNEQRSAVVEYVNHISTEAGASAPGGAGAGAGADGGAGAAGGGGESVGNLAKVLNSLTLPLHPAFQRAYAELESVFENNVIQAHGQGLLDRKELWDRIVAVLPALPEDVEVDGRYFDLKKTIAEAWARPDNTPKRRWAQLKSTLKSLVERAGGRLSDGAKLGKSGDIKLPLALRKTLEKLVPALVFAHIYPRLDVNVSKQRNHLLKAPFCLHPKTGRVCVPINLALIDQFDPTEVPTCAKLMAEGMMWSSVQRASAAAAAAAAAAGAADEEGGAGTGAVARRSGFDLDSTLFEHTSMRPYIVFFEGWLRELAATKTRARRDAAERAAPALAW